jgi:hypothetical protein
MTACKAGLKTVEAAASCAQDGVDAPHDMGESQAHNERGAHKVGSDEHAPAVEAVDHDTRDGAEQ